MLRQILLADSSDACDSQGRSKAQLGGGNSSNVSHVSDKNLASWTVATSSQALHQQEVGVKFRVELKTQELWRGRWGSYSVS